MKNKVYEFCRRGLIACGFGPVVLAIVYLFLQRLSDVQSLTVNEVCTGIFSLTALAFVAGGMNFVYQIERLPLMIAVLIHGAALYVCYLCTYLVNGWLKSGDTPVLVFSCVFVVGYLTIWAVIYSVIRRNTRQLNEKLKKKQKLQ